MKDNDDLKITVLLRECGRLLNRNEKSIDDEDFSHIVLELDRLRAILFFNRFGIEAGCKLAPQSGHQPSCDGNCIATRGTIPCSIAAYQDANPVNEDLKLEGVGKDCDDAFKQLMNEWSPSKYED